VIAEKRRNTLRYSALRSLRSTALHRCTGPPPLQMCPVHINRQD
jgi:hypothetical protein